MNLLVLKWYNILNLHFLTCINKFDIFFSTTTLRARTKSLHRSRARLFQCEGKKGWIFSLEDQWVVLDARLRQWKWLLIGTLRLGDIRGELSIWLYFIKHWTMLTSHASTISKEWVMILYYLRKGLGIDINSIIQGSEFEVDCSFPLFHLLVLCKDQSWGV